VEDRRISVIAFATSDADAVLEVHLHVGTRGLLVVCAEPVMPMLIEVSRGLRVARRTP
jgi:hypothetical protein